MPDNPPFVRSWRTALGAVMIQKHRNTKFGIAGLAVCAAAVVGWWWFFGMSREQTAELVSVQGAINIDGAAVTEPGWKGPAKGRQIAAGADGFATIRLADGSLTQLTPGTRLTVAAARQSADGTQFRVDLKLDGGEVLRDVPSPAPGVTRESNLVTPVANIGVRGTYYLVRSDAGASRVMVHRGAVVLGNGADAAKLTENYGTVAALAKAPEPPSVLLPPPGLAEPAGSQQQTAAAIQFTWQVVPQAKAYVLEIARDAQFRDLVLRQRASLPTVSLTAPLPHDARFYWRVASLDGRDLLGRGSEPRLMHYKYFHTAGKARVKTGDAKGALELYQRAETGYNSDPVLLKEIGWAHYLASNLPAARTYFDRAITLDGTDLEARIQRGRVLYWLKDLAAAQADYDKVLATAPDDLDAVWGLAEVERAQGRQIEALAHLDRVLAKFPQHEYALFGAAQAALALGQKDRARELLARELKLRPAHANAAALYSQLQRKPLPPE